MKKINKLLWSFVICFVFCLLAAGIEVNAGAEEYEYPHYVGVATATVNVREGPGVSYDQVTDDSGKPIQLTTGDEVEIFEEKKADDGKVWYHIAFSQKGNDYLGFSTSSYVAIDKDRIITPAPTPTPEPTPEIVEEIKVEPADEVTNNIDLTDNDIEKKNEAVEPEDESSSSFWKIFWLLILLLLIFVACIFVSYYIRNKKESGNPSRDKIDKFKQASASPANNGKKMPQFKTSPNVRKPVEENRRESHVVRTAAPVAREDNYVETSMDDLAAENESDLSLREKIDRLQDHDIVKHVIYGEGEVSDNSDVKLLEVKFGNDTRYLKKDQLVRNHELTVYDDEDQSLARRRRRKAATINRNY